MLQRAGDAIAEIPLPAGDAVRHGRRIGENHWHRKRVYVYANRLPAIATPALKEGRPHRATYGTAKHQGLFRFIGLDRLALARSIFGQFCH
jgi:hypothetical protein